MRWMAVALVSRTYAQKREELESRGLTVSDEQTILYDDVVVATERIGCRVAP